MKQPFERGWQPCSLLFHFILSFIHVHRKHTTIGWYYIIEKQGATNIIPCIIIIYSI